MDVFIEAVGQIFSTIFTAIINAFASLGNLIFTVGETGTVTGITPFAYVLALVIGVPLATWLVSKGLSFIKLIKAGR